jgi:8-oxo-dGTP pyrophosphatase MutT (NUDIX family)
MSIGVAAYEVVDDRVVGQGGFLTIRRLRLRLRRDDGTRTPEGVYDFVERPMGLDAVVVALWNRRPDGGVDVLVRDGLRVPLHFGRPGAPDRRPMRFSELVAGILETGEDSHEALQARAAAEALEEAGLRVDPARVRLLGAATLPTPGMCPEEFRLASCEVTADERARAERPPLDGSPFEEGACLRWLDLDEAIAACVRGEIRDMKTEVTLRRLRDQLG